MAGDRHHDRLRLAVEKLVDEAKLALGTQRRLQNHDVSRFPGPCIGSVR
jgi:hypothetical protein